MILKYRHWHPEAEKRRQAYLSTPHFIAMAHPHFRRAYYGLNNFYPHFIGIYWRHGFKSKDTYIALDEDRVRIDIKHGLYAELDTWFGAPFSEKIEDIRTGMGKLRPPADLSDRFLNAHFANAYALDVKWSEKDGIKTFQALELKTDRVRLEIDGAEYFPVRYVHAEYDLGRQAFRHFDGAVQYFEEADYFERRDADFNFDFKRGRHSRTGGDAGDRRAMRSRKAGFE